MKCKFILASLIFILLNQCSYDTTNKKKIEFEPELYSSSGFVLVFDKSLLKEKIIKKKINNDELVVLHPFLPINSFIKILNPENSNFVIAKIKKNDVFPAIYKLIISKKIHKDLNLNSENPYIEFYSIKLNKNFIAKKAVTFEEEKNVAGKAPVKSVGMENISQSKKSPVVNKQKYNYSIIISDFYFIKNAKLLKKTLYNDAKIDKLTIRKLSHNKFRLVSGPFVTFSRLKKVYSELNILGFDDLDIYRDYK